MRRQTLAAAAFALTVAASALPWAAASTHARGEHRKDHGMGVVTWMGRLQYYAHKLGLAVGAGNRDLQGYYLHEVEEVIEQLEKVETLDGVEIGKLVKAKLVPAFEALETAVEQGNSQVVEEAYGAMLGACNNCHKAANRPYLRIIRRTDNPYMQSFQPAP
jgi:hypothetical protein